MKFLKQLGFVGLAGALLLAVGVGGERGQAAGQVPGLNVTPVSNAVPAPVRTAYGKVRFVAGQVLMLDIGGHDMRFVADENTDVIAKGGRATRTAGGGPPMTDLVRAGDIALVAYRESNGSMRALEIQVKGQKTIAAR